MISEILGLLVNILTTDDKYFLRNSYRNQFKCNYKRNKKVFLSFLLHFWILYQILIILKKRWPSLLMYFQKKKLRKTWLVKCLKRPVFRTSLHSQFYFFIYFINIYFKLTLVILQIHSHDAANATNLVPLEN